MTTRTHYIHICDAPNCGQRVEDGGSFFEDKHLCPSCQRKLTAPTRAALRAASTECARESHEGGTTYFNEAMIEYHRCWDQALQEITKDHA